MIPNDWFRYIPQQWVGIVAVAWFAVVVGTKFAEKYAAFAKMFPFGTMWHDRQKRKELAARPGADVEALELRINSIAKTCAKQAKDIQALQTQLAVFTDWSVYDAGWHHRVKVTNAERDTCVLLPHYDFFEFQRIWRKDPLAAAKLSTDGPT